MIIRVDKCHSFGMKKVGSSSRKYKPKLYINNELIPAIEINESFKYLGRHFDYIISNQEHKDNLCDTVEELLKDIAILFTPSSAKQVTHLSPLPSIKNQLGLNYRRYKHDMD